MDAPLTFYCPQADVLFFFSWPNLMKRSLNTLPLLMRLYMRILLFNGLIINILSLKMYTTITLSKDTNILSNAKCNASFTVYILSGKAWQFGSSNLISNSHISIWGNNLLTFSTKGIHIAIFLSSVASHYSLYSVFTLSKLNCIPCYWLYL